METAAAYFDEDPGSHNHSALRADAELEVDLIAGRYFLSWATGANEFRRSQDEFESDYQAFVIRTWPESRMFLESRYWKRFFLVLLRHRYSESQIGQSFPIQSESKAEKALRTLMINPAMQHAELAKALKTTEKQLLRMSEVQVAFRELSWNFVYPERPTIQRKG